MKTLPLLLVIFSLSANADIIIDNYTAAENDRYTNDSNFILDAYDLSGVGQASNGRWATLISPNTVISANHFKPSGDITFSSSNSTADSFTRTIDSANTYRISGTDLWVACLTAPAPATTNIFSFDTTVPTGSYLSGTNSFTTGRSPETNAATFDQAHGTNLVTSFLIQQDNAGLGVGDYIELDYNNAFPPINYTDYESALQVGDSGAPLFYDDGSGDLTLLGVNSYISTNPITGEPAASYVSHTGRYTSEINGYIDQFALKIPEPSSAALLSLSLLAFINRRQRAS